MVEESFQFSVFSFQFSVFSTEKTRADSRRYKNGATTMTRKRWTGKALAERRRRGMQLHLAGFTQEEITDKLGLARTAVCRDLQSFRDARPSGDSPDLEEARFTQMAIRKRGQAPYTLYEVEARYTKSGSKSTFQGSNSVPRRRSHPGTKGGSTTHWSMDTAPD